MSIPTPESWIPTWGQSNIIEHVKTKSKFHMDVSENSGTPPIINFNRVFHYEPSILGYHYFWNTYMNFLYYRFSTSVKFALFNSWHFNPNPLQSGLWTQLTYFHHFSTSPFLGIFFPRIVKQPTTAMKYLNETHRLPSHLVLEKASIAPVLCL